MLDKIDAWQVFWSILIMLCSYIAIMITLFRTDIKEMKKDLLLRVTIPSCKEIRADCEKDCKESRDRRDEFIKSLNRNALDACQAVHRELSSGLHVHGNEGKAGEVIPK